VYDSQGHTDPATDSQDYWELCARTVAEKAYWSVILAGIDFGLATKIHCIYETLPNKGHLSIDELESPQNIEFLETMLCLRHSLVNQVHREYSNVQMQSELGAIN